MNIDGHRMTIWRVGSFLMLCLWLCACNENTESSDAEGDLLRLTSYVQPFVADHLTTRAEAGVPEGFFPLEEVYSITDGVPPSMAIFMVPQETSIPSSKQLVTYRGEDQWQSYVGVKQISYYIHGYLPDDAVASATLLPYPTTNDYSQGAQLVLSGLSSVSKADVCVVTGVQDVPTPTTPTDLNLGRFRYVGKPTGQNYVGLLLEHIYSAVDFRLQVNATYYALRRIKLKKLTLKSTAMGSVEVAVTLRANETGTDPISAVRWTPLSGSTGATVVLYEDAEGRDLTTEPCLIQGYMSPQVSNRLTVECEYDVYDIKGNLVREGCTAENYLGTKVSSSLQRGQKSVVTLIVNPTFLYQLSDADLDNPTMVVD